MPDIWVVILATGAYATVILMCLIAIVADWMTSRELRRMQRECFYDCIPGAYDRARREGRVWGENDERID